MSRISKELNFILASGEDDNKCLFCGEKITEGGMWSTENRNICVGSCCKRKLIKIYKDIVLDEEIEAVVLKNGVVSDNKLDIFRETLKDDMEYITRKEIKIEDVRIANSKRELERRIKQNEENKRIFKIK